jgi:hypothetical protein
VSVLVKSIIALIRIFGSLILNCINMLHLFVRTVDICNVYYGFVITSSVVSNCDFIRVIALVEFYCFLFVYLYFLLNLYELSLQ